MKATLQNKQTSQRFAFYVEIEGQTYNAVIWLNEKGKFIDDMIYTLNDNELEHEGEEGTIREKIINYLDKNWDSLTA